VGIYKPVCSGAERDVRTGRWVWSDVERLGLALERRCPAEMICPQAFRAPLAPPIAASHEGRRVDAQLLRAGASAWEDRVQVLLVEGAGGWRSPMAENETAADLARDLGFPVLIVGANRLGTINHSLMTLESVERAGLSVAGIVLNGVGEESDGTEAGNEAWLARVAGVRFFGTLPHDPLGELRPCERFTSIAQRLWAELQGLPSRPGREHAT
jgi:dethiobiotin synthetase